MVAVAVLAAAVTSIVFVAAVIFFKESGVNPETVELTDEETKDLNPLSLLAAASVRNLRRLGPKVMLISFDDGCVLIAADEAVSADIRAFYDFQTGADKPKAEA